MKIRHKVALLIFVVGMLTLLVQTVAVTMIFSSLSKQESAKELTLLSKDTAYHLDIFLEEKAKTAVTLASAPVIEAALVQSNAKFSSMPSTARQTHIETLNQEWMAISDPNHPAIHPYLTNKAAHFLKQQQKMFPRVYGELFLTDRFGVTVATTGKLTTLSHGHKYWWKAAFNGGNGNIFFDDRGFDNSVQGVVLGVVVPVKKEGEVIGILKCNLNIMGSLTDLMTSVAGTSKRNFKIVRSGGWVVLEENHDPLSTRISNSLLQYIGPKITVSTLVKEANESLLVAMTPVKLTTGSMGYGFGGNPKTIDHIKGNSGEFWSVIFFMPQSRINDLIRPVRTIFLTGGLIFIVILSFCAWWIGNRVTKPVNVLIKAIERIGHGDFETRVHFTSNDEFSIVAGSVNIMTHNLLVEREERIAAENHLIEARDKLEEKVEERTAALNQKNRALQNEMNERQQVMQALKESTMWLTRMFHSLDESVQIVTPDRKLIDVNHATEKMFGYTKSELEDLSTEILHVDHAHYIEFGKRIEAAFVQDKPALFEFEVKRKNGEVFPSEHTVSLLKNEDGSPFGIVSVLRDISQRKAYEKQVKLNQEKLEQMVKDRTAWLEREMAEKEKISHEANKLFQAVEVSPVSVVITDNKGTIEYVNNKFTDLTQYEKNEAIGQNPRVLKSGKHEPAFYNDLWQTLLQGKEWHGEFCNMKKDGALFWEKASIGPVKNNAGEITHYVAVKEDTTELKKMIEDLKSAQKEADRANHAKSLFLSSMSHELRTPLNSILGFSQILMEEKKIPDMEKRLDYINKIYRSGRHLLRLINDILDLAKIESGKMDLSIEKTDPFSAVESTLELLQHQAGKKQVTLKAMAPDLPILIEVDTTRYQQILLNLVSNAIKYNVSGGSVTIDFSIQANESVHINVRDTGRGIPKKYAQRLFDPFDRLGAETSNIQGTGIGLTITKVLVESMNGEISFQSRVGEGTTFTVTFPCVKASARHQESMDASSSPHSAKSTLPSKDLSLLYVEDDYFNRHLFEAIVAPYPTITLHMAKTANQGIDMAQALKPDIIFMDIGLPDLSGYDAFNILQKDPDTRDIPVVGLSAGAMPADIAKAKDMGFNDYLTKPFGIGDLLEIISTVYHRN